MKDGESPDFFISYNHRDEAWATWIAWVLEEAHLGVVVQAWDFRPGNNFVLEMQVAAEKAKRTIAVLSSNYFGSEFVKPEWAAAFAADPSGDKAKLVPVRIEKHDIPGMLGQINYIDFVGIDADEAKRRLLAGIQPGRAKPATPPPFPGTADHQSTPSFPGQLSTELSWSALPRPREARWRDSFEQRSYGSPYSQPTLELQLLAEPAQRLEVRRLGSLADELIGLGRLHGLFTASQQVERIATDQVAMAHTPRHTRRDGDFTGVMVARDGQRGFWLALPHDGLGSVFDASDVTTRVRALLDLLLDLPVELPDSIAVGVRIEPVSMLQVGSVSVVGSRNSASMPFATRSVEPVVPEDTVTVNALKADRAGFVAEIVARLESKLRL